MSQHHSPSASSLKLQPCTFFLQGGNCKYGTQCRYGHFDPSTTTYPKPTLSSSSKSVELCKYYTEKGFCKRGNDCEYKHEIQPASIKSNTNKHDSSDDDEQFEDNGAHRVCRFWRKSGSCARGKTCGYLHPSLSSISNNNNNINSSSVLAKPKSFSSKATTLVASAAAFVPTLSSSDSSATTSNPNSPSSSPANGMMTSLLPVSRCFKRCDLNNLSSFEQAVSSLLSIKEVPEHRCDLKSYVPDENDVKSVLRVSAQQLAAIKERKDAQKVIKDCGLTDDDIKALFLYKAENPYPVYKWLNGWLSGSRRDDKVRFTVGPFFTRLYRAMEKLPKIKNVRAARAVLVRGIPALKNTFDNYLDMCKAGGKLSFWSLASFSTNDDVINAEQFIGKPEDEAIIYSCGQLEGVDMECWRPDGQPLEQEILPMCPCVFEIQSATKIGKKLNISLKQIVGAHFDFAYVDPGV